MTRYIEAHRGRYGVEPICRTLGVAPSTYYAGRRRPPSARARRDDALCPEIARVHRENYSVYGADKVWAQLRREGLQVARCTVERLMRRLGLRGAVRGKPHRTTDPDPAAARALPDLVERDFRAPAPNRLWVADITYCRTFSGFVYAAFVIDACSRRIVGWQMARHLRAELALDALEMAIWARRKEPISGVVHHADRGVQYLAIRYTERLAEAGAVASVGSRGDSYDNALAESTIGLFKTELLRARGPWRGLDDLEIAALEYIDWFNHRRLHSQIGMVPPAEFEEQFRTAPPPALRAGRGRPAAAVGGAAAGLEDPSNPMS
jgi:putative transposase